MRSADNADAAAPARSTRSLAAQKQAVQSIPFNLLDQDARTKAKSVISNASIYRRLPMQVVDCDPQDLRVDMPVEVTFRPLGFAHTEREVVVPFFTPAG